MKAVVGGIEGGGSVCSDGSSCEYYESGTGNVTGVCMINSNSDCVCRADHSSVVHAACDNGG